MIPHCDCGSRSQEECCFCLLPEISDLGYVLQSVDKVDRWPAGTQCSSIIIIDFQRKGSKRQIEVSNFQRVLPRGTKPKAT